MEELKTARAQLVHARIAPRKVQIVCDMIRGKDTKIAEAYMANTPKAGCELMLKLLKSACANAENNFEMDPDNLYPPATSPSSWLRRHKGGGRRYGTES